LKLKQEMPLYKNEKTEEDIDLYVGCDCHDVSHAVKLWRFAEDELLGDELYLTFVNQPRSFWDKCKAAWQLVRHNTLYSNEIVLHRETWLELANVLAQAALRRVNNKEGVDMPDRILNLTQHEATDIQRDLGVVEPDNKDQVRNLLTFEEPPTSKEMINRAKELAEICRKHDAGYAMIGGAGYFMGILETVLREEDVKSLHSFTKRVVWEEDNGDGTTTKKSQFVHTGWVK